MRGHSFGVAGHAGQSSGHFQLRSAPDDATFDRSAEHIDHTHVSRGDLSREPQAGFRGPAIWCRTRKTAVGRTLRACCCRFENVPVRYDDGPRELLSEDPESHPAPSSQAVSAVMRGNRKIDTLPELRIRSELHRRGMRFRKHLRIRTDGTSVTPDIVFPRRRVAVFVDGCFWHGCSEHGTRPKTHASYWAGKLERNRERDARVDKALASTGWRVVRIWEHVSSEEAVAAVIDCIEGTAPR
jgi:DNA mismatch endonuclease (patch repair protein)